ncbi:hypothetical protein Q760_08490 [Cellulomonas cellasea DSM 20118]|uniref:Uncharacterized protein n=1 Tax=Cellulomonas cellasea DSM 20118 TaxID=1408250 RepID=A0A0A0B2Y9_9CELL|nr:hypothetical protein Q760_08490 [Cellulomonas cellasea DSM 20118]
MRRVAHPQPGAQDRDAVARPVRADRRGTST